MANKRLAQAFENSAAVRIGVVDIEIAPYNPASVVAYNATNKYERIGTIVPGTAKPEFTREKFKLERGLPKTTVKSLITGQSGKFGAEVDEYSPRAVEIANGGARMVRTTTNATTVSAAPAPTTQVFTVAAVGTIAAGDWLAITIASLGQTYDRAVDSISGSAITLRDPLPVAPAAGDAVAEVSLIQQAIGGTETEYVTARLVYTDADGNQAIMHMPKVESTGKLAPDWKPNENATLPMEFDVHGTLQTINGKQDYYLGSHYFIPAGGTTV